MITNTGTSVNGGSSRDGNNTVDEDNKNGGNGAIIGGNSNGNAGNTVNNAGNRNITEKICLENVDLIDDTVNTNSNDLANSIYDEFLGNLELIDNMELEKLEELITEIDSTINRVVRFNSNN